MVGRSTPEYRSLLDVALDEDPLDDVDHLSSVSRETIQRLSPLSPKNELVSELQLLLATLR